MPRGLQACRLLLMIYILHYLKGPETKGPKDQRIIYLGYG